MDKAWFASKRIGYGAGMPLCWQGWALLALFAAGLLLCSKIAFQLAPADIAPFFAAGAMVIVIICFSLVIRAKTEGGWRWRNGGQ